MGTSVSIQVDASTGQWAPQCSLYVAGAMRGTPLALPQTTFAPGALLHLDIAQLLLVQNLPLSGGVGVATFNVQYAVSALAGRPLYVQAALEDLYGKTSVSPAAQVILN